MADKIITKPATREFRVAWDAIFGRKVGGDAPTCRFCGADLTTDRELRNGACEGCIALREIEVA